MNNHHHDLQHRLHSNSSRLVRPALLFFCPPAGGAVAVTLRCPPTHKVPSASTPLVSVKADIAAQWKPHSHTCYLPDKSPCLCFSATSTPSSSSSSRITNTRRKQPHLLPPSGVKRCAGLEKLQRWQLRPLVCFSVRVKSRSAILCSRVEEEEVVVGRGSG